MFFYKVEGHMLKLSSFGQGKTIRPKKSLTSLLHAALQLLTPDQQITNNSDIVKLICMIIFFTCPIGQKGGVKSVTFLYQAPLLGPPPPTLPGPHCETLNE